MEKLLLVAALACHRVSSAPSAPPRSETRAMPTDDCIRFDDRQRIASLGNQSIKTNEYQPIKNTKGLPSRRGSPQNVDLLPKHPDLCLQCCSRSH